MNSKILLLSIILYQCEAFRVWGRHGIGYMTEKRAKGGEKITNAENKPDIFQINNGIEGLIEGDVISRQYSRNTIRDPSYHWTATSIPYKISDDETVGVDLMGIASIRQAMREYKLRTCVNFVPRSNERDYIIFEKRTGCYSAVGKVGGRQTISIGAGCQQMAVVCHEIMHALGAWHEQSRTDRDEYVEIIWDAIEPGKEHNFVIADSSDALGVPYDHESVMHYSSFTFSADGRRTIVTKNTVYQDVIGQRSTLSIGDSTKINEIYDCADTVLNSYNCNFDDEEDCGYTQDVDLDDVDWLRYDVLNKSSVLPNLPSNDATLGVTDEGAYMVLDTSQNTPSKTAVMRSKKFITKSQNQCVQFSFYLNKGKSSSASLAIHVSPASDSNNHITFGEMITTLDADSEGNWLVERVTIDAPREYKLTFVGITGGYGDDVVAIDDVSVQDKKCDDDYIIITNYSGILETFSKGEFFLSPIITSTEGYNFQLRIDPLGSESALDGHMSIYIRLTEGPDDDRLLWPLRNKHIQISVVDRDENPLYAMNKYRGFLTSDFGHWERPSTSQDRSFWGYASFMAIDDLTGINNFLKHDSLMISVLVEDVAVDLDEIGNGDARVFRSPNQALFSSLLWLLLIKIS